MRQMWWGGPPGPRLTPSSASCYANGFTFRRESRTRGSGADEGVRPTRICVPGKSLSPRAAGELLIPDTNVATRGR
jgi:hypothetical protein